MAEAAPCECLFLLFGMRGLVVLGTRFSVQGLVVLGLGFSERVE